MSDYQILVVPVYHGIDKGKYDGEWFDLCDISDESDIEEFFLERDGEELDFISFEILKDEGFDGILIGKNDSVELLIEIARLCEEEYPFREWYSNFNCHPYDASELEEQYNDAFIGEYRNENEFAYEYLNDTCEEFRNLPQSLKVHFDGEGWVNNGSGNFLIVETNGKTYAFHNS